MENVEKLIIFYNTKKNDHHCSVGTVYLPVSLSLCIENKSNSFIFYVRMCELFYK